MGKNKGRGQRILAEQRRRAEAKQQKPTLGDVLAKRGLVALVNEKVQDINQRATIDADRRGKVQLKVVSCHSCTAPKGCCKITTTIFLHEAIVIAAELRELGRDTSELRAILANAADKMEQTKRDDYLAACVFLDAEERCSIYSVRAATCGTALVFSPPEICSDFESGRTIARFDDTEFALESTKLASDFYTKLGLSDRVGKSVMGVLPRMVLVALEAWERTDYQTFLTSGDWAFRAARAIGERHPADK